MNGFSGTPSRGIVLWQGQPDSQAAHDSILAWLKERCDSFYPNEAAITSFLNILKGNLGEAIALCVGDWNNLKTYHAFPANAHNPLSPRSKPDIDIVWVFFGDSAEDDLVILQEVKTTGSTSLSLADKLIEDYDKLFGTNPALTVHARLQSIKNVVEYTLRKPELCPRLSELAGKSPQTSPRIQLLPTLVHEQVGSNPELKMVAIRSTLCGKGWPSTSVDAWAIGLSEIDKRLIRLALGQS